MRFSTEAAFALGSGLALAVGISGCFEPSATIGMYCELPGDCGADQGCENGICGRCGNGEVDAGELCFEAAKEYFVYGVPQQMLPFDIDDDQDLDVLVLVNTECGPESCWKVIITGNEGGEFFTADTEGYPGHVESFDVDHFDGDQQIDALIAPAEIPQLILLRDIFGAGLDGQAVELETPPRSVVIADLDDDGDLDAAMGSDGDVENDVSVVLGGGDGTFAGPYGYSVGAGTRLAKPGDMDGDDVLDLVVTSAETGEVVFMRGAGDGSFGEQTRFSLDDDPDDETYPVPFHSVLSDLDDDGHLDILVANLGNETIAFLPGGPDGPEDAPKTLGVGALPAFIEVGDLNGDESTDILVANSGEDTISFVINRGGEIPDSQSLDTGFGPQEIVREDFNGDEVADLLISYATGFVSLSLSRN